MRRLLVRTVAVASLAALVLSGSVTAQAKSSRPKSWGGKKPIGQIVSFDAATSALVVDMAEGDDFTGTLAPDAQIKIDHRGHSKRGESHGNPTRGSLEDVIAGAAILRMKAEDGEVTKIRLRPAATTTPAPEATPLPDAEDAETSDEDAAGSDTEEPTDPEDTTDTEETDDEAQDGTDGDEEDALPPSPAPQP